MDRENQRASVASKRSGAGRGAKKKNPPQSISLGPAVQAAIAGSPEPLSSSDVTSLQRLVGNRGAAQLLEKRGGGGASTESRSSVYDVVGRGGGSPLDPVTREKMETSLGADLSRVRVHTGPRAAASAASVGAAAYTVGDDVVMPGGHATSDQAAQHTMAHELAHVVQQRSGPVSGTPAPGGIQVSDPSDRFE